MRQYEFAKKTGISQYTLSRYLTGKARIPVNYLFEIKKVYGLKKLDEAYNLLMNLKR